MSRVRRCDKRCHEAQGKKCRCWCSGAFHGSAGSANRAAVQEGVAGVLEDHGFKTGETVYLEQTRMSLPEGRH